LAKHTDKFLIEAGASIAETTIEPDVARWPKSWRSLYILAHPLQQYINVSGSSDQTEGAKLIEGDDAF
jgi:hypothetical protein